MVTWGVMVRRNGIQRSKIMHHEGWLHGVLWFAETEFAGSTTLTLVPSFRWLHGVLRFVEMKFSGRPAAVVITVLKTIAHKLKSYTFISTQIIGKSPIKWPKIDLNWGGRARVIRPLGRLTAAGYQSYF